MSGTALILQHGESGPPGLLARWCVARGIPAAIHHAGSGPLPPLNGQPFVASLGSKHNPDDTHVEEVAAERAFLAGAIARHVPVLGLCFGGQMLSSVLGGTIDDAPEPELGWHAVDTEDDDVVPGGPWLSGTSTASACPTARSRWRRRPSALRPSPTGATSASSSTPSPRSRS